MNTGFVRLAVATVPTVYGIETLRISRLSQEHSYVATVPTVYGIETVSWKNCKIRQSQGCNSTYRLRY